MRPDRLKLFVRATFYPHGIDNAVVMKDSEKEEIGADHAKGVWNRKKVANVHFCYKF